MPRHVNYCGQHRSLINVAADNSWCARTKAGERRRRSRNRRESPGQCKRSYDGKNRKGMSQEVSKNMRGNTCRWRRATRRKYSRAV